MQLHGGSSWIDLGFTPDLRQKAEKRSTSVLKAGSSTSFEPATWTPRVYQDAGTQLSSLWGLGLLQWMHR